LKAAALRFTYADTSAQIVSVHDTFPEKPLARGSTLATVSGPKGDLSC
jgi:hypothetical protein